ncbi:Uncharacterised protein [Kluyvera cryocrescens]|uniref:Uncharacterized protein n=1 Tax=Kluyvera cryocrescens TaxID=580 RepID=A0A485B691_KLUCR|nr:Uncharacterised protein [Kluyvera cryocrescens]
MMQAQGSAFKIIIDGVVNCVQNYLKGKSTFC